MKNIAERHIEEKGQSTAFPFTTPTGYYEQGMSLKEYYAGIALQALIPIYVEPANSNAYRYEWIDICRQAEAFGRLMVRAMAEDQAKAMQMASDKLWNNSDVKDAEEQTGGWG
jgi:hypothetical protein